MKYDEVKDFGLVIIESLKESDLKTGTLLHNGLLKYKKLQEPNLSSFLFTVKNKEELFQTLHGIIANVKTKTLFPILHLEMHGSVDGVRLTSNEFVIWDELLPIFREINILLLNSLTVMTSMCMGITLAFDVDTSNRAPFNFLIGTIRDISGMELLKAYEAFYDRYFFSFDPIKSLVLMNNEIDAYQPTFDLLVASEWFDRVVAHDKISRYSLIEKERKNDLTGKIQIEICMFIETEVKMIFGEDSDKDYFLMSDLKDV